MVAGNLNVKLLTKYTLFANINYHRAYYSIVAGMPLWLMKNDADKF